MIAGCVLEESDVASPELLKRLDSRRSRQDLLQRNSSLKNKGHEASEPLLITPEQQSHFPYGKLLMLTSVWLAFFAVQILRGGKSGAVSLHISTSSLSFSDRGLYLLRFPSSPFHSHGQYYYCFLDKLIEVCSIISPTKAKTEHNLMLINAVVLLSCRGF